MDWIICEKGLDTGILGCSSNLAQGNGTLSQGSRNRNGEESAYMENTLKKRSIGPSN